MKRAWHDVAWVEVWISNPEPGDYVLVLRQLMDGSLEILDPQEGGSVVMSFASYEEAEHWLNEEEYDLMHGRYTPEDH